MRGSNGEDNALAAVDSNILVYARDWAEPEKRLVAQALLVGLITDQRLVVSAQSLNEFFVVMTRANRPERLSEGDALVALREIAAISILQDLTSEIAFRAMEARMQHGFAFWDALIWAAAKEAGAATLYTEDFQHGRDIEGVRIVNPFLAP